MAKRGERRAKLVRDRGHKVGSQSSDREFAGDCAQHEITRGDPHREEKAKTDHEESAPEHELRESRRGIDRGNGDRPWQARMRGCAYHGRFSRRRSRQRIPRMVIALPDDVDVARSASVESGPDFHSTVIGSSAIVMTSRPVVP